MYPIYSNYEKKHDLEGIMFDQFAKQFDAICQQHLQEGRANSFAFILYEYPSAAHEVLRDRNGFVELDRLSGKDMTIFYLLRNTTVSIDVEKTFFRNFIRVILELTGQPIENLPLIVFFDYENGEVTKFTCQSFRDNDKLVLLDLSNAITKRINEPRKSKIVSGGVIKQFLDKTVGETPKILYGEFIKHLLKGIINN